MISAEGWVPRALERSKRLESLTPWSASWIGIGAGFAARPLPHHRAYGSVHGGRSVVCTQSRAIETEQSQLIPKRCNLPITSLQVLRITYRLHLSFNHFHRAFGPACRRVRFNLLHPRRSGFTLPSSREGQPQLLVRSLSVHETHGLSATPSVRAFVPPLGKTTMPSADFSDAISSPRGSLSRGLIALGTPEISRGKFHHLRRTPAESTPAALDGYGLRGQAPARPATTASIRFLSIWPRLSLRASFRPRLAATPLRFARTSPPSGCTGDFHPQVVEHARHTLLTCGASRLVCVHICSKHKAANDFQSSLEEAAQ